MACPDTLQSVRFPTVSLPMAPSHNDFAGLLKRRNALMTFPEAISCRYHARGHSNSCLSLQFRADGFEKKTRRVLKKAAPNVTSHQTVRKDMKGYALLTLLSDRFLPLLLPLP